LTNLQQQQLVVAATQRLADMAVLAAAALAQTGLGETAAFWQVWELALLVVQAAMVQQQLEDLAAARHPSLASAAQQG
jgi:hypothetical protein